MKIINSTYKGQIFTCPNCNKIHIEFGNVCINLTQQELKQFKDYVNSIDYQFYLYKNRHAQNRRKLLLNIGASNSFLALNVNEFIELKNLLSNKNEIPEIKNIQILISNINLN
ncbi:MAG: DUF6686 family protein [Bacteroidota bacterium]|nr:DUF6686 family protein [Bacteroidota bacterium]